MSWLSRNAETVEAGAAVLTALVAVAALIGVKIQLDEAERLQKTQSAREAYRSHLALAATLPKFSAPDNSCALIASDQAGAYTSFVDHLLYSAEQMLEVSDGWSETFLSQLEPHRDYLCSEAGPRGETEEVESLLRQFRATYCVEDTRCGGSRAN